MYDKKGRVTDPEEFILTQIYRPYQNLLGLGDKPISKIPYSENKTIELLCKDTERSRLVLDRISGINPKFSIRINHPVITVLVQCVWIHKVMNNKTDS